MALTFRFLFDECLPPSLFALANDLGYEATHVRNLKRLGDSDRLLASFSVERDWIFVTNNRIDCVRIYRKFDLHPGLVVILPSAGEDLHLDLFEAFAKQLPKLGDLVNKLIDLHEDGRIEVQDWPPIIANDRDP